MEPLPGSEEPAVTIQPAAWTAFAALLAFSAAVGWPWIMLEAVDMLGSRESGTLPRRRRLVVCTVAFVAALCVSAASWYQGVSADVDAARAVAAAR